MFGYQEQRLLKLFEDFDAVDVGAHLDDEGDDAEELHITT